MMIGMGIPSSQSKIPRPMRCSYWFGQITGEEELKFRADKSRALTSIPPAVEGASWRKRTTG